MNQHSPDRVGLNSAEAAIAWAYARWGGDLDALEAIGGDAGRALRPVVEEVLNLDDQQRAQLVESWRRRDRRWDGPQAIASRLNSQESERLSKRCAGRWRRAFERLAGTERNRACPWSEKSLRTRRAIARITLREVPEAVLETRPDLCEDCPRGFGFVQLAELGGPQRDDLIRQLGLFQLAELVRHQDRRNLARLRHSLGPADRQWFDHCIVAGRQADRHERGRLRELFVAVSRQEPDLIARLMHLGLYSIAAAAGQRFSMRVRKVARRLPASMRTLLLHYHGVETGPTRQCAGPVFRASLDEFVSRRRTCEPQETPTNGGAS